MVPAEVVIVGCRGASIGGLVSGFVRLSRTLERAQDQTPGAQSRRIAGIQFGFALRAVWHFGQTYSMRFAAETVTSSARIRYCSGR
jgi:hypothetical protein